MTLRGHGGYTTATVTDREQEQRIAREESHWNAPRMFVLGFGFLALCLTAIFAMAFLSEPRGHSLIPWW